MGKKIDQPVKDDEAKALAALFSENEVENYAEFARKYEVPGGKSMVKQHLDGARPISMDAALAYIRGFRCDLRRLSPRLADAVSAISHFADTSPITPALSDQEAALLTAYRAADERARSALLWMINQIHATPLNSTVQTTNFALKPSIATNHPPALKAK